MRLLQMLCAYFESSHTHTTHTATPTIGAHTTTAQHTGAAALRTLFIVHSCVFLRAGLLVCRRPPSASYVRPASSCRTASNRPARHRCCYWPPHLDFQHQRDEPHRFSTGTIFHPLFFARPPLKSLLRRKAPPCQPAQRKKILSSAQEAYFVCPKGRWRLACKVVLGAGRA